MSGPYLGQKPPGMTPEIFAPGFISTCSEHSSAIFSRDGKELFFCRFKSRYRDPGIFWTKEVNGKWTDPKEIFGTDSYSELTPFLSADGDKLFFTSTNRGDEKCGKRKQPASIFWISERSDDGWSNPRCLNISVPNEIQKDGISMTNDGTAYFWASCKQNGKNQADLFFCKYVNGKYDQPERLVEPINSSSPEGFSFIAPDERYLILSSFRAGGYGMSDLYICFKNSDGSWTKPINMGPEINSPAKDGFPSVSADGKYLFFNSSRISVLNHQPIPETAGNIYWIDAKIIEILKYKAKK